ncbi:putative gustatory receptor 28b [Malaya genurostris]|uniref:putative gustatory receptor 28b n=1 Tax=Malaya genurostris TaxID=325434 RepID=UPI0026F382AF|nr:putative gustatory receptor 28b [Malaya genurostris]
MRAKVGNISSQDSSEIYIAFQPLYYMAKVAGLWPQTLKRTSPGFSLPSITYQIALYCVIGICLFVNSDVVLWTKYMSQMNSNILQDGLQIHVISGLIMAIIMGMVNLLQHQKKWTLMESFGSINSILSKYFFVTIPYKNLKRWFYFLLVVQNSFLLIVILSYYYFLAYKLKIETKLLYVSYYIINMTSMAFTIDYVSFVISTRTRLQLVNRLLKQLLFDECDEKYSKLTATPTILKVERPKIEKYSSTSEINQFIDNVSNLHNKIGEIIILLNRIYSFQLMLNFCAMFLFLVFGLFASYKAFNAISISFKLLATANGFWIFYYLITMITIIYATSSTVNANFSIGDTVHRIIRMHQNTLSSCLVEKLSTFSLQLKMREITFSCGLFNFDWPLFASILAAVTMYLVFLIQFDVTPQTQTAL